MSRPKIEYTSKITHPNFKIDPFFLHLLQCFPQMWDLGVEISYDEATQGFKDRHHLKVNIKYKKAGDGYLIDCVPDDGFIFTFYQRTNPAPRNGLMLVSAQHRHVLNFYYVDCQVNTTHIT